MGGPHQQPAVVARGAGWTDLALSGGDCFILSRGQGTLLRVPLQAGASPVVAASGLAQPNGLFAAGDTLYWLETATAPGSVLAFVPTAGPMLRLRMRDGAGAIRTISDWPGARGLATLPGSDIVGATPTEVYARVIRPASTEFVRFRLPSGEAERVAIESGSQHAVVREGQLYWTAPSDEAASDAAVAQVRRPAEDGGVETVAEWLPAPGVLLARPDGTWYASSQLYRLPRKLGPAEIRGSFRARRVATDGARVILLDGPTPQAYVNSKE